VKILSRPELEHKIVYLRVQRVIPCRKLSLVLSFHNPNMTTAKGLVELAAVAGRLYKFRLVLPDVVTVL
jgi:hypothetical protein